MSLPSTPEHSRLDKALREIRHLMLVGHWPDLSWIWHSEAAALSEDGRMLIAFLDYLTANPADEYGPFTAAKFVVDFRENEAVDNS